MMLDIVTLPSLFRRGRANALRLDPACVRYVTRACELRQSGDYAKMRFFSRSAVIRAGLLWRTFADLPPAA